MTDSQFEYLSLVATFPELIDRTILVEDYFDYEYRIIFNALKMERVKSQEFIIDNLVKYKNFNLILYTEIISNSVFYSNKDKRFNELEKTIIDNYKLKKYKEFTKNFNGNCDDLYKKLTMINEINYCENDYIKSKDIIKELTEESRQVKLGYDLLDDSLNLSKNDLLIFAAGTNTGKTSFALNLLSRLSKQREYQLVYFNMEMSKSILYKRLIAIETGIILPKLNNIKNLEQKEKIIVNNAINDIETRKIILINKTQTIEEIQKTILKTKSEKHIIAIIDHIGLIKSSGNSIYEKMTNIAKGLRSISIDLDCTLIGLCQLSRESQRKEKEPVLQDLRDSGEIEQSARKVILIYSPDNKQNYEKLDVDIIIAKNDDGNKCTKHFKFNKYTQQFVEDYLKK